MPQLDFSTFPNQIFWLVVTLVAIYFILSKVALPRIASVLAERQGTLTNDLAAAEDLKRQAVEAEEAYNKALADARAESQRIAEETRAGIQANWQKPRPKPMSRSPRKPPKAQRGSPRSRPTPRNPSKTWRAMWPVTW
jgi:F-type H+-transporting ATPase subunit b